MQWIDDTGMEEDAPKGEGEFSAKEDKKVISLHQKYPFFSSSPTFPILSMSQFDFLIR